MTLYDLLKVFNSDFDTYDNVYDAAVTVCSFDEEDEQSTEYYDKFRIEIMKFIEVTKGSKRALWCNWSDFIKRNIQVFREFEAKYWCKQYVDEDDFIYQWIKEIDAWVAGAVSEHIYKEFVENYMSRMKPVMSEGEKLMLTLSWLIEHEHVWNDFKSKYPEIAKPFEKEEK